MNYSAIVDGMKSLIDGLKNNIWPDAFFSGLLRLPDEIIANLPKYAFYYMVIYGIAALISLALHFWKKHKSFSNLGRKLIDFICCIVALMCCWIIPQFIAQGKLLASQVQGEFSFTSEGISWLSEYLQAWFDPIWLGTLLLAIAAMPLLTVKKYIKKYKLVGIPWAIFDEGFALFCMSAAILAMANSTYLWYAIIPAAILLIILGQTGGADLD